MGNAMHKTPSCIPTLKSLFQSHGFGVSARSKGELTVEEHLIVQGLRDREEEAVKVFLERYRSLFYHCIGHFESDPGAREDLYQDLVVYALERLDRGTFDPEKGSFGTWLYRVAWCRSVDLKRRQSARNRPGPASGGDEVPDRADETPGPDERAGTGEIGDMVRSAMGQLAPEEQDLLNLRFVDAQTMGSISRSLGISLEQTKYRLRKAVVSMRKVLLNQYAYEEVTE
jgi:RNA polymerase sigma-70 factor (ECF subfamily)